MPDPQKLFRPLGQRAAKLKKRALSTLEIAASLDLPASTSVFNGAIIRNNIIDADIHRSIVIPGDGLVLMFSTYYGIKVYEFDNFLGVTDKKADFYISDSLIKEYVINSTGMNQVFTFLIQGQKEEKILENFPYYNTLPCRFVRMGSYFNLSPLGEFTGDPEIESYQFPDTWPTPALFHSADERFTSAISGIDLLWKDEVGTQYLYPSSLFELSDLNYTGDNKKIGGRISFFSEQLTDDFRPTPFSFFHTVSSGYIAVKFETGFYYPVSGNDKYYGTLITKKNGVLEYRNLLLSEILHETDSSPETHTGATMPKGIRDIILYSDNCSARPLSSWSVSIEKDRLPIVCTVIDLSAAENTYNSSGEDIEWFEHNEEHRHWRLSVHWHDLETGETWSFTSSQFWALLRGKLINLDMPESPAEEVRVNIFRKEGWYAAVKMMAHLFARPNHAFSVPHDTVTFFDSARRLHVWTRHHGSFLIDREGISEEELIMPPAAAAADGLAGIKPSMYFSHVTAAEPPEDVFCCVCERLERLAESDNAGVEGPRKVLACYTGSPFTGGWVESAAFSREQEGHIWTVCAAWPVIHAENKQPVLVGIARDRFVRDGSEVIQMRPTVFFGGAWRVGQPLQGLNVKDPLFGERWQIGACLFGGRLARQAMQYPTHPHGGSQHPCGPYDGYISGLP